MSRLAWLFPGAAMSTRPIRLQRFLHIISWLLPLFLFALATAVEFTEETFLEHYDWYDQAHFYLETGIFGILGPIAVFLVMRYIRHLLIQEHDLVDQLERLNQQLEAKVRERTAQLERTNQDLMRANAELMQLDQLKTDFVSLVSHELRAPLTAINGALEIALESLDTLPPSTRRVLEAMRDESARLTQFVQTILDVSRLEAGRIHLNLGPVAVMPLIHRAIDVVVGSRRPVQLSIPDKVPPIWADETHFEQVLRNLLRNADKFSPPGRPVEIIVEADEQTLSVEIRDHGPGIPPELQEKVFERFQRGTNEESGPGGWGLGLYFARRLTAAQNGTLTLRSPCWPDPDAPGAAFKVTMPLAMEPPDESE